MLALDTDSISAEARRGVDCFAAGAECGFRRFLLGTARDSIRGEGIVPVLRKARLRVDAVAGPRAIRGEDRSDPAAAQLAAPERAIREQARTLLGETAALASRLAGAVVTLDLGTLPLIEAVQGVDPDERRAASRNQALDRVLPALFEILRGFPGARLAVEICGSRSAWPHPADLEILLSELDHPRLGWWFDTARAWRFAREVEAPPEAWFERHRDRLLGATLRDAGDDEDGLPLGSGAVDFGPYRAHRFPDLIEVVRMASRFPPGALQESRRFLEGLGIV